MRFLQHGIAWSTLKSTLFHVWFIRASLIFVFALGLTSGLRADSISVFNFNSAPSGTGSGDLLVDRGNGTLTSSTTTGTFTGTTVGAQDGDPAGSDLAVRVRVAGQNETLLLSTDTTGFNGINFSLAGQRTATGFTTQTYDYSTNGGTTFTNFGSFSPTSAFQLFSFDLSGVSSLNNNPNAQFRITFSGATTASSQTNRIDNLAITGVSAVPEPSTWTMMLCGLPILLFWQRRRSCFQEQA